MGHLAFLYYSIADILVLDGDPLADLAAFTRVALVVHGGTGIRE